MFHPKGFQSFTSSLKFSPVSTLVELTAKNLWLDIVDAFLVSVCPLFSHGSMIHAIE